MTRYQSTENKSKISKSENPVSFFLFIVSPGMCGCADRETELLLLEEEQEELSAQAEETADKEQEKDLASPEEAVTEKPSSVPAQPPEEIYVDVRSCCAAGSIRNEV